MADYGLSRRDFLLTGASALLTPTLARAFKPGAPFHQTQKGWIPMATANSIGARASSLAREMGNQLFVFGGTLTGSSFQNTHAWFDAVNNVWVTITAATGTVPVGRTNFGMATNGTHCFVWGGTSTGPARVNSGGLFTPATIGGNDGAWVTIPTTGAPSAREYCTAVWCNNTYIVFGGRSGSTYFNDGGIYDPATNTWSALPAPSGFTISTRMNHAAVVTNDNRMIIFGGFNGATQEDGFIYNAVTGTWTQMATSPYPGGGWGNSVGHCWIGTRAFFWGGGAAVGATYNPTNNTWTAVTGTNAPTGAGGAIAWWNGTKVIFADSVNNFGIYNPTTSAWTTIPTVNGPVSTTTLPCLGYSQRRLCYWGGVSGGVRQNNGKMYYHPAYL